MDNLERTSIPILFLIQTYMRTSKKHLYRRIHFLHSFPPLSLTVGKKRNLMPLATVKSGSQMNWLLPWELIEAQNTVPHVTYFSSSVYLI